MLFFQLMELGQLLQMILEMILGLLLEMMEILMLLPLMDAYYSSSFLRCWS